MPTYIGDCCCGAAAGTSPCCQCTPGVSLRRYWTVTFAPSIANNACNNCGAYNDPGSGIRLNWHYPCIWQDWYPVPSPCRHPNPGFPPDPCCTHYTWRLTKEDDGYYLRANSGDGQPPLPEGRPTYFLSLESWNCSGVNAMPRVGSPGNRCVNWPTAVLVTPGADVIPPCDCWPPYDAIATNWQVNFQGVTNLLCNCTPVNALHTLQKNEPNETCGYEGSVGPSCCWSATVDHPGCIHGPTRFRLSLNVPEPTAFAAGVLFEILGRAGMSTGVNYWMPQFLFNPLGQNTLTLFSPCQNLSDESLCNDWPDTIDLFPA